MSTAPDDRIADIAAAVVADNPEIRREVESLVKAMLADARDTVKYGTPSEKAAMMRTMVPSLLRAMGGGQADAAQSQQQDAYDRMIAQLSGRDAAGGATGEVASEGSTSSSGSTGKPAVTSRARKAPATKTPAKKAPAAKKTPAPRRKAS